MLRIDQNSSAYKLADLVTTFEPSKNLCLFFWQAVLSAFFIIALTCVFTAFLGSPIISFALWLKFGLLPVPETMFAFFSILGSLIYAASFFFGLLYLTATGIKYVVERIDWGDPEEKEPNVLIEFIKAKKEKVCPRIHFYDSDFE